MNYRWNTNWLPSLSIGALALSAVGCMGTTHQELRPTRAETLPATHASLDLHDPVVRDLAEKTNQILPSPRKLTQAATNCFNTDAMVRGQSEASSRGRGSIHVLNPAPAQTQANVQVLNPPPAQAQQKPGFFSRIFQRRAPSQDARGQIPQGRAQAQSQPQPQVQGNSGAFEDADFNRCYGGVSATDERGVRMDLPRNGMPNRILGKELGTSREPGQLVSYGNKSLVRGKVSWFGGPDEARKNDGPAQFLRQKKRLRQLDPNVFYIAVRADTRGNKDWWMEKKIMVRNPATGKSIIAMLVDWGPHSVKTSKSMDLSPGALKALGLTTSDTAEMAFASAACQQAGRLPGEMIRMRESEDAKPKRSARHKRAGRRR